MTRDFKRSENLSHAVHRILLEQIQDARSQLSQQRLSDKAIHEARKSLKKARATLRLLRESIPDVVYQEENRALRDIARPLSAARDAWVMLETLDRLEKIYGPAATESIPHQLQEALKNDRSKASSALRRSNGKSAPALTHLDAAKRRVARATIAKDGWDAIGTALKRIYRKGRRAMKQAKRTPSADHLHEWRKQTKHLQHQLQVLEPLWPGMIGELGDQTHKLSDYLGDDHDLAVLCAKVLELQATSGIDAGALLALVDRCRAQLQEKAFLVGGRIFDDPPADFTARLERYWQRWRQEKKSVRKTVRNSSRAASH